MTTTQFRDHVRGILRDRLLDAAQEITLSAGWTSVTMGKIAARAGVSRQTVYNEFGSKPDLANELVLRELGRFLEVVRTRLTAHDDIVAGVESACEGALSMAAVNPLIKTALSSTHDGDKDLVALLTTDSQLVIEVATNSVVEVIGDRHPDLQLTQQQLRTSAEAIIRLVLSHITRPALPPAEAAHSIAWIFSHVLPNGPLPKL